ncbi:MAG: ATP-dependent Clp protease adapter ClpS [Spirochaetales bacterium]
MGDQAPGISPDVREREDTKVQEPEMYRVVLHNDDYTTMDFVIEVIVKVFNKGIVTAMKIMLDVHHKGRGEVGTYTYDIANTKVKQVREMARSREFPLKCTIERA